MIGTVLFDRPAYVGSLGWLGRVLHFKGGSIVARPLPLGLQDARGSWPYQSLPQPDLIAELRLQNAAINLTVVIRPDVGRRDIDAMAYGGQSRVRVLKDHLCHRSDLVPASDLYSSRTRKRLLLAEREFFVDREIFSLRHMIIADWQENIRITRQIAPHSSPHMQHFQTLAEHAPSLGDGLACIVLRQRNDGALCGMLLAGHDEQSGAWHAHSALGTARARARFGMYLLFDAALRLLGGSDIWFGGAPDGANGHGVFNFKQRFSNHVAPAHILSIDLSDSGVAAMSRHLGTFPYLPPYRNPLTEYPLSAAPNQSPLGNVQSAAADS